MLVRADRSGPLAIGQASHAWLSGQLARAWGNGDFDPPAPREEVCLAAEQHDVGMSEWDLAPQLDASSGLPQSFMQMAIEDHLRLWSAAPSKLISQSCYAALLVSMHGCALYERRDIERMTVADADAVQAYLRRERARQEQLIELLGADRTAVRRNQRLVFAWDGLSLALCLGWSEHVAAGVPSRGEDADDLSLVPGVGGGRFVLDPWPFSASEVTVGCEGRRLLRRAETEKELRTVLAEAPHVRLRFVLVPSARVGEDRRAGR